MSPPGTLGALIIIRSSTRPSARPSAHSPVRPPVRQVCPNNTIKTHKKTLGNRSKNAFFKNANFVARLFFEVIFERASQKEKKIATFDKWKLSDWPKNPKSNFSWTFGVRIIHLEHPSTPFHSTPLHCIPSIHHKA